MFENKQNVSMKSQRRFLHLSSFSDSNSFMTAGYNFTTKIHEHKRTTPGHCILRRVF